MSSTKNFNLKVKYTAYGLVAFILLVMAELTCLIVVSFYKSSYTIDTDIDSELLAAIEKMNHVRRFEAGVDYESLSSLIYSRNQLSLPTKEKTLPQIMIQGDSWAEQFLYTRAPEYRINLKQLESKMDVIYAGISSFSPSLMAAQIDWLQDNLNDFAPEVIVAIVDQTDFGDELCRYRNLRSVNINGEVSVAAFGIIKSRQTVYSVKPHLNYSMILNSDSFSVIKVLKLAYYRIGARVAPTKGCHWDEIVRPLSQGLSREESAYMLSVFLDYLRVVEKLQSVHTVIFVTHPHYKHISGEYLLEMGSFINKNVNSNSEILTSRLNVISLHVQPPDIAGVSVNENFQAYDWASHLTNKSHSSYYTNAIAEELQRHID